MKSSFYKSEFRALIREDSRNNYEVALTERKKLWDPEFVAYYEANVEPIVNLVSSWSASSYGWKGSTPLSIWSSNQSEVINRLFKRRVSEEIPMDKCFHHFRDMQRAMLMEVARY